MRDEYGTHKCLSTTHFHADLTDLLDDHLDVPLLIHPAGLAPCRLYSPLLEPCLECPLCLMRGSGQQLQILARQRS